MKMLVLTHRRLVAYC